MYIRSIETRDYMEILGINAEAIPGVVRLDENELSRIVSIASVACVAVESGLIAGYMFGFDSGDAYDGEEFRRFGVEFDKPFMYVDQLAVSTMFLRQGIGSALYGHLTQRSRELGIYTLCCEVNLEPLNVASTQFHERHRFKKLGEMNTSDGRLVALLHKALPDLALKI